MKFEADFPIPSSRRSRMGELDTLRALACGAVVLWHVLVYVAAAAPPTTRPAWYAASQLFVLGGPIFFFLSALLCFHRHPYGEPMPGFWGRRLLLLAVPYFVWSMVYVLLDLRAYQAMSPPEAAGAIGTSLLLGLKHLAFLNALFQFYLLFPLLRWLWSRMDGAALGIAGLLLGFAWLEGAPRLLPQGLPPGAYSYHAGFLPAWLPYVVLGAWASRHVERLGNLAPRPAGLWAASLLLLSLSAAALCARLGSAVPYPGAARWEVAVAALLWLPFLLRWAHRAQKGAVGSLAREFAACSPAVFFAHLLPLGIAAAVTPANWPPAVRFGLLAGAAVAGTGILLRVLRHSPTAVLVVGLLERPRRQPAPPPAIQISPEWEEEDAAPMVAQRPGARL